MKKKIDIFISMGLVLLCFILSTSVASAQTATKNNTTKNETPAGTFYLSDIVAASQTASTSEVVKVPVVTLTGNQEVDNANYIALMKIWMNEHKADYSKLDQKTRTVWESGDYKYFVQYEIGLGNFIKAERQ